MTDADYHDGPWLSLFFVAIIICALLLLWLGCSKDHDESTPAPTIVNPTADKVPCYPVREHDGPVKYFPQYVVDHNVASGRFCLVDGVCYLGCPKGE